MAPNLAQVLNTLAHEIRTPLAVSQGYLKLYLDGRFANEADARKAFEQTRQALGVLATLCSDMGKVSTIAGSPALGIPQRITCPDFVKDVRGALDDVAGEDDGLTGGAIESTNPRDLAQAVAVVMKAAFNEDREAPRVMRAAAGSDLILLAGAGPSLERLPADPGSPEARPVDYAKGGHGLTLIWAAFVLEKHCVQAWTTDGRRASVGFRIPLVHA